MFCVTYVSLSGGLSTEVFDVYEDACRYFDGLVKCGNISRVCLQLNIVVKERVLDES